MRTKENTMHKIFHVFLTIMLASFTWLGSSGAAEGPLTLDLASSTIQISTFYNGTTLDVSGTVPADMDVVLQVSGPKKDVHLKEKGKVAGFLWMNKTDISLENTPAVYMVYTPNGPTKNFIGRNLGIGYKALVKDITIIPESADKDFIFGEYVKLMEESGVYAIHEGTISYGQVANETKTFKATLTIPSKMSAGAYTVEALAVQNGAVLGQARKNLDLELSGLPKTIANLAYHHSLMFGFMAVFIAIAVGLFIGIIFKGGGGAH